MRNIYPTIIINIDEISTQTGRIRLYNEVNKLLIDMYVLNLFPDVSDDDSKAQLVLCNNGGNDLTIVNGLPDIINTGVAYNQIGPYVCSYNNATVYGNTMFGCNSHFNTLGIGLVACETLYMFSFSDIVMPINTFNDPTYLWLGFKSKQEDNPFFYITKTNLNNLGTFGVQFSYTENTNNISFNAVRCCATDVSRQNKTLNLNDITVDSNTYSLSNVICDNSVNSEYLPYIYYCTGKVTDSQSYIKFSNNDYQFYKIVNNNLAVVTDDNKPLGNKIVYTLRLYNTNQYNLNGTIKLIDNTNDVVVDWGDGSSDIIAAGSDNLNLVHTFVGMGRYTIVVKYANFTTTPNYLSNIKYIDNYVECVDLSRCPDITALDYPNLFKEDTNTVPTRSKLACVKLPPNLVSMNCNGFCNNCKELGYIEFPTANCIMSGEWLKRSSILPNYSYNPNPNEFIYPANITFNAIDSDLTNDFNTGHLGNTIKIYSNIICHHLEITISVHSLYLISNLVCDKISYYSTTLTTLSIAIPDLTNIVLDEFEVTNLVLESTVTTLGSTTFADAAVLNLTVYNTSITLSATQFNLTELQQITGYTGSTAETFANENNITFVPIS
jgi:hypothetical protein